jgi:hypothetical protein
MGIDPVTHKVTADGEFDCCSVVPTGSSTLSHMSQWECARAEAEARLARQSCSTSDFVQSQDASTSFMSSWKAQVAETLRPSFGVVELDKTRVNLQTFLHDWESSLRRPSPGPFSAHDSPVDFPDFASGATSEVVSPQYTTPSLALPSSAQITERLLAARGFSSSFGLPGESTNRFIDSSPTSTLNDPDYDSSYNNSPCVSSGDSFDLLAQSLGLIHHENEQSRSMFATEPSFWSPRLQPPEPYLILPQLNPPKPSFMLPQVNLPNNIPIPQFDFLC